jgi:hypothetical protein
LLVKLVLDLADLFSPNLVEQQLENLAVNKGSESVVTTTEQKLTSVDSLMPGNRLDTLVAIRYMRWRYMEIPSGKVSSIGWGEWIDSRGHTQASGNNGGFHPSTDDAAAGRVLDFWTGDLRVERRNGMWVTTFFQPSEEWESTSGVRQVSICRAALKTAGAERV